jgi:hypothetical protein
VLAAHVCWVGALAGLVVALQAGQPLGWSGPGLSVLVGAALLGTLTVLTGDGAGAGGLRARLRRTCLGLVVVLLLPGPLAGLGAWAWHGWADGLGVRTLSGRDLPGVGPGGEAHPARVLALRSTPVGLDWSLVRDGGPRLGQASAVTVLRDRGRDDAVVRPVLDRLLVGGQDVRAELWELAVGQVRLLPPVVQPTATALDSTPGLVRVHSTDSTLRWRVDPPPGAPTGGGTPRVRIIDGLGRTVGTLSDAGARITGTVARGEADRLLVLAESVDPGWRARLDGRVLESQTYHGWAQAFRLTSASGTVVVEHRPTGSRTSWFLALGVLGLALLLALALGVRRPRRGDPAGPGSGQVLPVSWVHVLRGESEQVGDLFDDDVVDQGTDLPGVGGPGLHGPAVDHDPGWQGTLGREEPAEGDLPAFPGRGVTGRHVLDGELHAVHLPGPTPLQGVDGVQDEVVEAFGAAAPGRQFPGDQRATDPTVVPVAAATSGPGQGHVPSVAGTRRSRRDAGVARTSRTRIGVTARRGRR